MISSVSLALEGSLLREECKDDPKNYRAVTLLDGASKPYSLFHFKKLAELEEGN